MLQTHPDVEHIIVSDGPDPLLVARLKDAAPDIVGAGANVKYFVLPEHPEHQHWGIPARSLGIEHATGDYIGYCDDDDALRPEHCELLSQSLDENQDCGFTISMMETHAPHANYIVGQGVPMSGNVGTPMLMHRKELLEVASWGYDSALEDWELVSAWINAGIVYSRVNAVTIDVWPSAYR